MITIPLSDVVAFLTRRGVDLACLEGAPMILPGGEMCVYAPHAMLVGDIIGLYLGRGPVCPAAMGWAQHLLSAARGPDTDGMWIGSGRVELWTIGRDDADHRWMWDMTITTADEAPERTYLPGIAPEAPAERLRAVLLHEMRRA